MQISLDELEKQQEPYQLFLDSIKDDQTERKYRNYLATFLKLIPNKIYKDNLGSNPKNNFLS